MKTQKKIKWINLIETVLCFSSIVLLIYYSALYVTDGRYSIVAFLFLYTTAFLTADIYKKMEE